MAPRATTREWVGLAVLCLACLLYVMDLTILHLAVPSISADLEPSSTQLLWTAWIAAVLAFAIAALAFAALRGNTSETELPGNGDESEPTDDCLREECLDPA